MNYEFKMRSVSKRLIRFIILNSVFIIFLSSCSVQKQIAKSAKKNVLTAPALQAAHVGISIYEPAANKYWYNYQGEHYFVPASNTKIPTCYAAMKYLGDSLVGLRYNKLSDKVVILPSGDPTLLLNEFKKQPAFDFLKQLNKPIEIDLSVWQENPLGSGWSWNDYQETYMAERSAIPIYGNVIQFYGKQFSLNIIPRKAVDNLILDSAAKDTYIKDIYRSQTGNRFNIIAGSERPIKIESTFDTENGEIVSKLLSDTLKLPASIVYYGKLLNDLSKLPANVVRSNQSFNNKLFPIRKIKTQSTDSLLKPMMHRSDNFFAEQSLLMVSNERLGVMNDEKIIDTLLKTDFKDLPQKPRWVDGSGLSRYNLFTPQDLVAILNKMKNEFGIERIKVILPTGGEGTIGSYYKTEKGYIYAKTGSLSGVVAISGFLYTKKNKLLVFSVLVNNHNASATDVRKAVEKFLQGIRNKF